MAIAAGTKFGPYEILAPLGAGGMGEVYRAKDTRLDRIVALKVLSSDLSANPDLRQRFEREARAVSSLNHPNICTLYDVGQQDGIEYLVMEFIEGETLSNRLLKGPVSNADLLRYSIQIADALDKAHRKGIIHRDLKPGNIMLTKSGVKLLDFGLAKMSEEKIQSDVSQLATEHREITKEGTILGTMQYMAPEQLEGKETDARTDIFAFGAVVYEMATGKKAFEGASQASLIAAILKEHPAPMSQVQPLTPPILERLVKTCLEKDPEDRWQNAHDVCNELRWIHESSSSQVSVQTTPAIPKITSRSNRLIWIAAGALLISLIGIWMWKNFRMTQVQAAPEVRFVIPPYADLNLTARFSGSPDFAISHDGTKLVYAATDSAGTSQLWLRPLSSLTAIAIQGTDDALLPFWSPDDQQIAFFSQGAIRKITLQGGNSQLICPVQGDFFGGVWLPDGTMVFGSQNSGLRRVSSNGGNPETVTSLNQSQGELLHSFPLFLPDGKHFLYASDNQNPEYRGIFIGSLGSKNVVRLLDSRYKINYIDPGYLIFVRGTALYSQKFQIDPPKLLGEPSLISDRLSVSSAANSAPITTSLNGTILYRGGGSWAKTQLAWFDRNGKLLSKIGNIESDTSVRISPDGKRAVVSSTTGPSFRSGAGEESTNIWTIDLERGIRTRVTFDPGTSDENPVWSPDGRFLAFGSHRNADRASLFQKSSSGEGPDRLIYESGPANPHPIDWSPDGKFIMLHENGNRLDLNALQISDGKLIPVVTSNADDAQAQFSPDGRWIAYTSVESGHNEVYVRPFPKGEDKWQISTAGGSEPRWRGDGKELFYLTPDGVLMSVPIDLGVDLKAALPVILFKSQTRPIPLGAWGSAAQYDVSKDGSRFLINTIVTPPAPDNLYVIVNWHPPAAGNP